LDLKAIRDHLCLARIAIGPEHPLSSRIKRVEQSLTPGDSLWRNDAVSAQTELLAISTKLEQCPTEGIPSSVNEALKQIADALEML
jgi:hypothetical protein